MDAPGRTYLAAQIAVGPMGPAVRFTLGEEACYCAPAELRSFARRIIELCDIAEVMAAAQAQAERDAMERAGARVQ